VTLVTVPYVCHKILARVVKFLTSELERKTKSQVFFIIKRKIDSKWITANKTQTRPRSHTLTSVFENTLDDLCAPAVIIGKRIRCRLDGSRVHKVHLDEKDKEFMSGRLEAL
jgi:small subunit ribosomal protein S7e